MSRIEDIAIKRGQFMIDAVKKIHKRHKHKAMKRTYNAWATQNENKCFVEDAKVKNNILFSIIVPAFNTDPNHLLAMIYSVVNQHYDNWELIIVNVSDSFKIKQKISDSVEIDSRIKVINSPNEGIAANTNRGLDIAKGEYVAFLDHDDLLHPCALHSMAYDIAVNEATLLYSDEDKITSDGSSYFQPLCKPGWSPDLLRNVNYINHLSVIKSEFIKRVGGLRQEYNGAQDYDLLLRIIDECKPKILHVPRVLYHWRAAATSTARNFDVKGYVLKAGISAIQEHLDRNKINGTVKSINNRPGFYCIDYQMPKSISIVIGPVALNNRSLCASWVNELVSLTPKNIIIDWVIGDWYQPFMSESLKDTVKLITSDSGNYWQTAAQLIKGDAVICFQSCSLPSSNQYFGDMSAAAMQLDSIVAPVIIDNFKAILYSSLIESSYGLQPLFYGFKFGADSYYGSTEWNRNVSAISGQTFALSRQRFIQLAKYITDSVITTEMLVKFHEVQSCLFVSYAHTPFTYKGPLIDAPLSNINYFNPQLTKAQNGMSMTESDWGIIMEASEREIDQ
ncbi:MAG TPA: glycosyltransferase [Candidatus Saccharimonadales bacterium]|nr:glycosyltransferase [Candidatus Saccharimonadales bacterium]